MINSKALPLYPRDVRNDEEDQTIFKNHLRDSTRSESLIFGINPKKLICIQEKDEEVKTHGVNECGGKNCVIRRRDHAARVRDPHRGEKHACKHR